MIQPQEPAPHSAMSQLAESNQMGALQEVYAVPKHPVAAALGTFFFGGVFTFALIFLLVNFMPAGEATLVYFALLLLISILVFWTVSTTDRQIGLYSTGLIWTRGATAKVLRWEQIETLKRGSMSSNPPGVNNLDVLRITGPDKMPFSLPGSLLSKDKAFLCDTIERSFVKARLPGLVEQFNSGKPLIFRGISGLKGDSFTVSREGLYDGEELLPWSEVGTFNIDATTITIFQIGRTSAWMSNYVPQFPNACLLKALVEQEQPQRHW